jgi:2-oxoglutarate ferredoxin oxidoreductase subunit delta
MPTRNPKNIQINKRCCKGCGICVGLCTKVLAMDSGSKAVASNPALCTGCRICETHCPDFAISIGVDVN